MARHSSVSRADRNKARLAQSLESKLQHECRAVKSDRFQTLKSLEAKATGHFKLVAKLQAENSTSSRKKLRELRDVKYDTDPTPTCKGAWDAEAKHGRQSRPVGSKDSKHVQLMKGQAARNSQAQGL